MPVWENELSRPLYFLIHARRALRKEEERVDRRVEACRRATLAYEDSVLTVLAWDEAYIDAPRHGQIFLVNRRARAHGAHAGYKAKVKFSRDDPDDTAGKCCSILIF